MIGILGVGRENSFAEKLFNCMNSSELKRVQGLADASLAIVRGEVQSVDVLKIEVIEEQTEHVKPVYALSAFEWSAYTDAFYQRDKYWYYGSWRNYVTFILNAFSDSITWNCSATISYTNPCAGCSNCYIAPNQLHVKASNRRWWSSFIPSFRLGSSQAAQKTPDYSKVRNDNCATKTSFECDSAGIIVDTPSNDQTDQNKPNPHLMLKLINGQSGFKFINDSWNRLNTNQMHIDQQHPVRTVEITPKQNTNSEQEKFFYIDHEAFEVKPIRITILPKLIRIYSPFNT